MRRRLQPSLSLAARLAVKQSLYFALAVCVLAMAAYVIVQQHLYQELQERVTASSGRVREMLRVRGGSITWLNADADPEVNDLFANSNRYFQLVASTGEIAASSREPEMAVIPVSEAAKSVFSSRRPTWEEETLGSGVRLLILNIFVAGPERKSYVLRVGMDMETAEHLSGHFGLLLLLGIPLLIGVHLLIAWRMAADSLAPVRRLNTEVAEIAKSSDLHRPVTSIGTGDELDQLSKGLNAMIARFQLSLQHLRDFVPNVAHELRRPLTILRAETELALRWANTEQECRQALSHALQHIDVLATTIKDLVVMTEPVENELNKTSQSLSALVKTVVEGMRASALDSDVELSCDIRDEIIAEIDSSRIYRLVVNLVDNAVKYNRPRGRVHVVLDKQGDSAVLSVSDTGIGIAAADLERIFDRFYRSADACATKVHGYGLGLAFARMAAIAHGGHIEVTSTPGVGSCFRTVLPQVTSRPAMAESLRADAANY